MAVRFEPAMPIGAVRSRISTSGGGGGGGGGGGRGTNYSAEAIAVLNNQTERDLAYREEQVQQRHIDDTLLEIERQQTQGQLTPELANSLRIQARSAQMRHGVDPSEARLREAQARQYELENVQLSRQEDAALQQLTAARARIRERVAIGELSPAQGQVQDAYLQQQIAPLAARRTRAGALQQQMDAETQMQQAEERISVRPGPLGMQERWQINRYGEWQNMDANQMRDLNQMIDGVERQYRQEVTDTAGAYDPAEVERRIQARMELLRRLGGQGGQQAGQGPRLPRIVEGGTETFNPDAPLAGRDGVARSAPVAPPLTAENITRALQQPGGLTAFMEHFQLNAPQRPAAQQAAQPPAPPRPINLTNMRAEDIPPLQRAALEEFSVQRQRISRQRHITQEQEREAQQALTQAEAIFRTTGNITLLSPEQRRDYDALLNRIERILTPPAQQVGAQFRSPGAPNVGLPATRNGRPIRRTSPHGNY